MRQATLEFSSNVGNGVFVGVGIGSLQVAHDAIDFRLSLGHRNSGLQAANHIEAAIATVREHVVAVGRKPLRHHRGHINVGAEK